MLIDRYKEEKKEKKFDAIDEEFANKKFLEVGSPAASLRLIKDLKNIKYLNYLDFVMLITRRMKAEELGFRASPVVEGGGMYSINFEVLFSCQGKSLPLES